MKLTSRAQIETLSRFKGNGDPVTSLYLATDKARLSWKEIASGLKNLLSEGESGIAAMDLTKDRKDSLIRDLAVISELFKNGAPADNAPGWAVFCASGQGFRQEMELPHGPRNRLVFDANFYLRPLAAIIDRYPRICVLVLGRREAAWYSLFMGAMKPLGTIESEVPAKGKEGGFMGYDAKHIDRQIDARLQEHFKKVAAKLFEVHKHEPYDWLFIGCDDELLSAFISHSHTYIKDRFKGQLKIRPSDPPAKILKAALDVETRLKEDEEKDLVQKLVSTLERGGLAVSGLHDTLDRINRFEVQTLIVTHDFSKPGFVCPDQKFLYLAETECPSCRKANIPVVDIIDEAVETVLKRNGAVKQVNPPSRLDHYGHIGAFLKYKT